MATVDKIKYVLNEPFTNFLKNLLHEKFYQNSPEKVVRLLEVGCGPGDFALISKETFNDKINITAIDPSDDIEQAFKKSTGSDVQFLKEDIFTYKTDEKFDIVLFSKSLHHCNPVDQALKNAYNLLSDDGVLIAEEIQFELAKDNDVAWFLERLDLVRSAGCFISKEERIETAGPTQKPIFAKILDSSLPVSERWFTPHTHNHGSKHEHEHEHEHGHGHGEHHHEHEGAHQHSHDHQDRHHHQESDEVQKKLDREDPNKIATSNSIRAAIDAQFGKENVQLNVVPFFYQFFHFFGLKTDETCQAVLREVMKQEQKAVNESKLNPFGLNIVAFKKP